MNMGIPPVIAVSICQSLSYTGNCWRNRCHA
jgi:hypothetical protein